MKNLNRKILVSGFCFSLTFFGLNTHQMQIQNGFAAQSTIQEKNLSASSPTDNSSAATDAGASSVEQKGGIYKVGRGFKTAGSGMKKGFVKAGHGFGWLGHKFKNFFTGKSDNKETAENTISRGSQKSHLDQVGDDPQQSQTATDAKN